MTSYENNCKLWKEIYRDSKNKYKNPPTAVTMDGKLNNPEAQQRRYSGQ